MERFHPHRPGQSGSLGRRAKPGARVSSVPRWARDASAAQGSICLANRAQTEDSGACRTSLARGSQLTRRPKLPSRGEALSCSHRPPGLKRAARLSAAETASATPLPVLHKRSSANGRPLTIGSRPPSGTQLGPRGAASLGGEGSKITNICCCCCC